MKKSIIVINMLVLIFSLICLAGCQKTEEFPVTIEDKYMTSLVDVPVGSKVADAIALADLSVSEQDQVTPSLDSMIEKKDTVITIQRKVKASVLVDKKNLSVDLVGAKVKDALSQLKVKMGKFDQLNHDPEAYLTEGMQIEVSRRVEVKLTADGKTKKKIVSAETVGGLLKELKCKLGKHDRLSHKKSKKLKNGMHVVVQRVSIKKETAKESVPYSTTVETTSSMYSGSSKIKRSGKNGEKEITYKVTYVDGKEESREAVAEKITLEPISQILLKGTKKHVVHHSSNPKKKKKKLKMGDCN